MIPAERPFCLPENNAATPLPVSLSSSKGKNLLRGFSVLVGELVGGKSVVGAEGLGLLGELVNRKVPDLRNIRKEGGGS